MTCAAAAAAAAALDSAYLSHGSYETNVLEGLPVQILPSIVHSAPLEEQLQQRYRLLGAILIHLRRRKMKELWTALYSYLRHVQVVNEHNQSSSWRRSKHVLCPLLNISLEVTLHIH